MVQLVCAGETFEDVIFHDLHEWPRLGEEFRTDRLVRTWGGGALITAVAAARQGLATQVVSVLAAGAEKFLRGEGLRVRNLRRGHEPHALTVALSTRDDRAFVTYPGANHYVEERVLQALPRLRARHVHLALEPLDCSAWLQAVRALRAREIGTSWDFGWNSGLVRRAGFSELQSELDYVFLNQKEAALYSPAPDWTAYWRAHVRCAVIKLGERGCLAVRGPESWESQGQTVETVDSTGAGDAFNGGFLTGLLEGRPMIECLRLGNEIGAASTRCAGGLQGLPER